MFERIKAIFRKKSAPPAVEAVRPHGMSVRSSASQGGSSNPMMDTANILSPLHPLNPASQLQPAEPTQWRLACEQPSHSRHEDATTSNYESSSYSSSSCDSSSSSSDSSSSSSSDSGGW